jgi:hypothetical protein
MRRARWKRAPPGYTTSVGSQAYIPLKWYEITPTCRDSLLLRIYYSVARGSLDCYQLHRIGDRVSVLARRQKIEITTAEYCRTKPGLEVRSAANCLLPAAPRLPDATTRPSLHRNDTGPPC